MTKKTNYGIIKKKQLKWGKGEIDVRKNRQEFIHTYDATIFGN